MSAETQLSIPPVAMHDRYGPLLRSFFARYFGHIAFPQPALERIRQLSLQGTVVYIAPVSNLLHFLYLNHICVRHQLPLARFVNGIDPVLLQPIDLLWERMRQLSDELNTDMQEDDGALGRTQMIETVRANQSALVFLRQPETITNPRIKPEQHLIEALIRLQQQQERPIYLVPHLIKWDNHPQREDKSVTDAIFGEGEAPGFLRSMAKLIRHHRSALVKVSDPIDLKDFVQNTTPQAESPDDDPTMTNPQRVLSHQLFHLLNSELFLEVFDVAGPRIRSQDDFRAEILADPKIQDYINEKSQESESKKESLRKTALDLIDEIAAEPRIHWPLTLNWVLNVFWKRMYEGFVVDETGFDKIRTAVRKGPIVFCPSHKSHVDYLVLSQICLQYRVPLPHIAAGVNLSFWPMGPIFRHSGAFFLRRSFKGDDFYPIVFRTYLRHVMSEGFPIEFFIEGTRSRTGKLLGPRFGILSWLFQAFLEGAGDDLQFVPISIDYEKVVESRSYLQELSGGEKQKEDVSALLKSRKVLRSRFGKIYVQIADPISVKDLLAERQHHDRSLDEDEKRSLMQELAHRILFEINSVSTITPSAIVAFCLLNNRRRGMNHAALIERARWLRDFIKKRQARFSATLDKFERALGKALARFSQDGLVQIRDTGLELVYSVVEKKRLALDYYRNNVIHHFVPTSISMLAIESFTVEAIPYDALKERIRNLSQLFKHEFLFRAQRHIEKELKDALTVLKDEGAIREEDGFIVKVEEGKEIRQTFKAVLEHFVEAYWLAAKALGMLKKGPLAEKEFLSRALNLGNHYYIQGDILWQEAISRDIMKNAITYFTEFDFVHSQPTEGRRGNLLTLNQNKDLEECVNEIYNYLNRQ